jgi:uncharacterized C2H2 Zn-finger protein
VPETHHPLFGYKSFNAQYDPLMSFRDRHRFLDGVYNSYQDPAAISAKELENISQRAGLSMEEVLSWFEDEKVRRKKLLANSQQPSQLSGHQFLPSPARTTTPAANTAVPLSTTQFASRPGTFPELQDVFSPPPALPPQRLSVSEGRNQGRLAKHQSPTALDLPSPESKRQKTVTEYPCPDCGKSFAVERWSEHVKRVHFPDQVWECQKTNERTWRFCGSKPFFRLDNFETHLKCEHGCNDTEISQLKVICKFRVRNFFHRICGFCDDLLMSRDESIEHIKYHFREISQRLNPPEDLGVSEWKEKCGSDHKLQRGVHYHVSKKEDEDPLGRGGDCGNGGGPSQDIPDDHSHDNPHHQPDKSTNTDGRGGSAEKSSLYSSQTSRHMECRRYSTASLHSAQVQAPVISAGHIEFQPHSVYPPPQSPTPSHASVQSSRPINQRSQPPRLSAYQTYPYPQHTPSLMSRQSPGGQDGSFESDEFRGKGRCPDPECGKVFRDLKTHMLTHQNVRPQKCPIASCEYHIKGFARKYDKNRHALKHYKGTMVCGFCPGSASAEKAFNRVDVFKRHLMSVHSVEQTPLNSQNMTSGDVNGGKMLAGDGPDASGKCPTCSAMFQNAQDFYDHLDDCVLWTIQQQEDPSEGINAQQLAEVGNDPAVHESLNNNAIHTTAAINQYSTNEELDDADDGFTQRGSKSRRTATSNRSRVSPDSSIPNPQSSHELTHPKGGVDLRPYSHKNGKGYPASWGSVIPLTKVKKCDTRAFDGQKRLWKDDVRLSTDCQVRNPPSDGKSYVTNLDIQTLKRVEGLFDDTGDENACENEANLEKLIAVKSESLS